MCHVPLPEIHVYAQRHIHVHMCTISCIHAHAHTHTNIHTNTHIPPPPHTHTCMHACIQKHLPVDIDHLHKGIQRCRSTPLAGNPRTLLLQESGWNSQGSPAADLYSRWRAEAAMSSCSVKPWNPEDHHALVWTWHKLVWVEKKTFKTYQLFYHRSTIHQTHSSQDPCTFWHHESVGSLASVAKRYHARWITVEVFYTKLKSTSKTTILMAWGVM